MQAIIKALRNFYARYHPTQSQQVERDDALITREIRFCTRIRQAY